MRIGSVSTSLAMTGVSGASSVPGTRGVTGVSGVSADFTETNLLDDLTASDRALLQHLYGPVLDLDSATTSTLAHLAGEIARERAAGAISEGRDITAEDLRRILGRLTVTTGRAVDVDVQSRLLRFVGSRTGGRLDVVL